MKKSPGMLKMWQRRWFVLDAGVLTYYKNHDEVGIRFQKQVQLDKLLIAAVPKLPSVVETAPPPNLGIYGVADALYRGSLRRHGCR